MGIRLCGSASSLYQTLFIWLAVIVFSHVLLHRTVQDCEYQPFFLKRLANVGNSSKEFDIPADINASTSEPQNTSTRKAYEAPPFLSACMTAKTGNESGARDEEDEVELGFELQHPVRPEFLKAMKRYILLHRKIMKGDPGVERKFVVASPDGQLCNRMRGVVGAFTLAFLTDRAFLVNKFLYGEARYHDLFLNPGFDIENVEAAGSGGVSFSMSAGDTASAEQFTCTDWLSKKDAIINLPGANYINTYLYRNPFLQKKLRELFLDDDLYRPILFWLFRPRPEILDQRDAFIKQNLSSPYLVTFHIRTEYPVTDAEYTAYNSCATAVTPPAHRAAASWFVATDNEAARETALLKLSNASIFYSPEKFVRGSAKEGLVQALLDILIAASGDQVFLTPFSSYSRMIGLYAPTPHVYMVSDYGIPEADPHRTLTKIGEHCYRFLSKEDCVWHGHQTTVLESLKPISCYTPDMIPDYC